MPPFPNISRIGLTFDLSPTDLNTVNVKIFRGGNFRDIAFFAKFSPRENKPHTGMTLLRKYEKYRENYPHVEGLESIFAIFFPAKITTFTVLIGVIYSLRTF